MVVQKKLERVLDKMDVILIAFALLRIFKGEGVGRGGERGEVDAHGCLTQRIDFFTLFETVWSRRGSSFGISK